MLPAHPAKAYLMDENKAKVGPKMQARDMIMAI
jgi:hypothetical protein